MSDSNFMSIMALYYLRKKNKKQVKKSRNIRRLKLILYGMSLRERNYLSSEGLMKSVKEGPWYTMYANGSDTDFIAVLSLSRESFEYLLERFKTFYIIHSGNGRSGRPRRVSDHHCVLALLLHTYTSPAERKTWCELYGVTPSSIARLLNDAEIALKSTLDSMYEARIVWPSKDEQYEMALKVQKKENVVTGRFAFADGKNYPILPRQHPDTQNATYNGWLHGCFCTGVTCFAVSGLIIWSKINYYGSWNDSEMSRGLQNKLVDEDIMEPRHGILTDSAFPVSGDLFQRIMTPCKEGDIERSHPQARLALMKLSSAITSMRQSAEWGMGAVSKVYRILNRKLMWDSSRRGRLLYVLHKLYNYRVRTTGISQIKNYFDS